MSADRDIERGVILGDILRYQDRWISHQTKRALSADPRERALLARLMEEDKERIAALRKQLARKPKAAEEPGSVVTPDRQAGSSR